ncbi:unnamed protein product, partial [Prorocentrum cordatum]
VIRGVAPWQDTALDEMAAGVARRVRRSWPGAPRCARSSATPAPVGGQFPGAARSGGRRAPAVARRRAAPLRARAPGAPAPARAERARAPEGRGARGRPHAIPRGVARAREGAPWRGGGAVPEGWRRHPLRLPVEPRLQEAWRGSLQAPVAVAGVWGQSLDAGAQGVRARKV